MNTIRLIISKITDSAGKYPISALIIFLFIFFIGFYFMYYSDTVNRTELNRQKAESMKVVHAALVEADKNKKLAAEAEARADAIEKAAQQRASNQTVKDKEIDTKLDTINKKGEEATNEINQNFQNDLSSIESMSDEQRSQDICSRLERLAINNPELSAYSCSDPRSSP